MATWCNVHASCSERAVNLRPHGDLLMVPIRAARLRLQAIELAWGERFHRVARDREHGFSYDQS